MTTSRSDDPREPASLEIVAPTPSTNVKRQFSTPRNVSRYQKWASRAEFGRLFWRLIPFSGDDTVTSLYYLRNVRQERGERVVVPFSKQLPPTEGNGHLASGSLGVFTLSDLLQLVAASPVPTRIHIASHGAGIGYVDLADGFVIDAQNGQVSGLNALSNMMWVTEGEFSAERLQSVATKVGLRLRPHEAILECARIADESNREGAMPDQGKDKFDSIHGAAVAAYLERRYDEAVSLFEACLSLRPGDRRIVKNLTLIRKRLKP